MSIASPAIRKIAVEAYLSGKATQQQLADILGFHRTAIVRWVREYRNDGRLEPQVRGHMARAFSDDEKELLATMIKDKPDLTLEEIREAFSKNCSLMAVHRELKRLGFRYKKNSEGIRTRTRRHSREQEEMGRVSKDCPGWTACFYRWVKRKDQYDAFSGPFLWWRSLSCKRAIRSLEDSDDAFINPAWRKHRMHSGWWRHG